MKMVWRAVWTAALLAILSPGPSAQYTNTDQEAWKPWTVSRDNPDNLLRDEDSSNYGVKYCRQRMGTHKKKSGESCKLDCSFCNVESDECPGRERPDIQFGAAPFIQKAASSYSDNMLTLAIEVNHGMEVQWLEFPGTIHQDIMYNVEDKWKHRDNVCSSGGEWREADGGYMCHRNDDDRDSECVWSICRGKNKPNGREDCSDQYVGRFKWTQLCHPSIDSSSGGHQCDQKDGQEALIFHTAGIREGNLGSIPHLPEPFLYRGAIQLIAQELLPPQLTNFFRPIVKPGDETTPLRTVHHNLPYYLGFPTHIEVQAELTSNLPEPELIRKFVFRLMTVTPPDQKDQNNKNVPFPSEVTLQFETQVVRPWRFTSPTEKMVCGSDNPSENDFPCYSFAVKGPSPDDPGSCYRHRGVPGLGEPDLAYDPKLTSKDECDRADGDWRIPRITDIHIKKKELYLIDPNPACFNGAEEEDAYDNQQSCESANLKWRTGKRMPSNGEFKSGGKEIPDACHGDKDAPDYTNEHHKRICSQFWELKFQLSKENGEWLCNPNAEYEIKMPLFDRNHPPNHSPRFDNPSFQLVNFPFKLATPYLCPQLVGYARVVASIHGWTDKKCKKSAGNTDSTAVKDCDDRVARTKTRDSCEADDGKCTFDVSGSEERKKHGRDSPGKAGDEKWANDGSITDFTAWDKGYFRVRVTSHMLGFSHIAKVRVLKIQIKEGESQDTLKMKKTLWCRGGLQGQGENEDCNDKVYPTDPNNFSIEDGKATVTGDNLGIIVNDDKDGSGKNTADFEFQLKPSNAFVKSTELGVVTTIAVKLLVVYDSGRNRRLLVEMGMPEDGGEKATAVQEITVTAPRRTLWAAAREWFRTAMLLSIPILLVTVFGLYCRLRTLKKMNLTPQPQDKL